MRPLLLLVLFVSPIRSWPLDEVVGDMRDSNTVVQIRSLPESAFNLADMKKVAEQFLRSDGAGHDTAVLSLYADQNVAAQEGGVSCEGEYRQWKVYHDGFPKGPLMVADVVSIRKDAVLRLRTSKGAIMRHVISGKDPLLVSVDGVEFEILSLAGRRRSRFEGCGVPGVLDPILSLKTNATLTEDLCQRATSALATKLGSKYVWADFRNDHWFLCGQYGIQYPFLPLGPPPSEADYYSSPEYTCSILCEGAPRCTGPTLTPSSRRR
jgi:hypothetical protein